MLQSKRAEHNPIIIFKYLLLLEKDKSSFVDIWHAVPCQTCRLTRLGHGSWFIQIPKPRGNFRSHFTATYFYFVFCLKPKVEANTLMECLKNDS